MEDERIKRIRDLRNQLAGLEAEAAADRAAKFDAVIAGLVKDMSYSEMCELREALNKRISSKYADDLDE